jgi:hypothetical protein
LPTPTPTPISINIRFEEGKIYLKKGGGVFIPNRSSSTSTPPPSSTPSPCEPIAWPSVECPDSYYYVYTYDQNGCKTGRYCAPDPTATTTTPPPTQSYMKMMSQSTRDYNSLIKRKRSTDPT